jgi:hypothetical protein
MAYVFWKSIQNQVLRWSNEQLNKTGVDSRGLPMKRLKR